MLKFFNLSGTVLGSSAQAHTCAASDPSPANAQSCATGYEVVKTLEGISTNGGWKPMGTFSSSPYFSLWQIKEGHKCFLLHPATNGIYFPCPWIWAGPVTHADQIPWHYHAVTKPKLSSWREGPHGGSPMHQTCKWRQSELSRHPRHQMKTAKKLVQLMPHGAELPRWVLI